MSPWRTEKLKHLASVAFSSVDKKTVGGEALVRLCNYTDVYYRDEITADLPFLEGTASADEIRRFSLRAGDVLITKDSETPDDIGVAAFVPETLPEVLCGYHLAVLRPDSRRVYPRFLFWSLKGISAREQMTSFASGVTRFGLRRYDVLGLQVPVPTISSQSKIARFLDREIARIDSLIDRKRALMAVVAQRRQSAIDRATVPGLADGSESWVVRPLRKLAGSEGLFTDGDWIESPYITDDGIRLIQTGNIGIGAYREQGFRYVSEETYFQLDCTEVLPGDVLICRLADPVGRACLAPDLGCRMITSVDVCILRTDPEVDRRFLVAYLSSSRYLSLIDSIARGGTRDRVSREQLGQVIVPVPPLDEQRRIADALDENLGVLHVLWERLTQQIDLLREHRQALISAAVTGEVGLGSGRSASA